MNEKIKLKWYYWIPVLGAIPILFFDQHNDRILNTGYFEYQMIFLSLATFTVGSYLVAVIFHLKIF